MKDVISVDELLKMDKTEEGAKMTSTPLPEADIVLNTDDADKQVIIFKDAGCC